MIEDIYSYHQTQFLTSERLRGTSPCVLLALKMGHVNTTILFAQEKNHSLDSKPCPTEGRAVSEGPLVASVRTAVPQPASQTPRWGRCQKPLQQLVSQGQESFIISNYVITYACIIKI